MGNGLFFSAAYFLLSMTMTLTNKAILSSFHFNFPFILLLWQVCHARLPKESMIG